MNEFSNQSDELNALLEKTQQIKEEVGKVLVGQHRMVDLILSALLSHGHVLIEGVPGIAKTLAVKLMAKVLQTGFSRIQFTPDLMPGDVIGTAVYNPKIADFEFKRGPVFSNFILIDEINRAPAKTQAALFEAMEERQVTYDGITYPMEFPFMVIATQNPIDYEGTYRLPEAQLDRFLYKIVVQYPSQNEELAMLHRFNKDKLEDLLSDVQTILQMKDLLQFHQVTRKLHADEKILQYVLSIIQATRQSREIYLGASPRAANLLLIASKSIAVLRGRDFVIPEDVKYVVHDVLRHRIILTPEREMENASTDDVITDLLKHIEVPK